tara:strand:+ start:239 stop:565 length:327 start_codon:yes stop_codon:yes gene_type:complete
MTTRLTLPPERRTLLFWTTCLPTRLLIAESARRGAQTPRLFAAVISYRWLSGIENKAVGVFGGAAWWAGLRHAHGLLWGAYAALGDWRILLLDTALGAYSALVVKPTA